MTLTKFLVLCSFAWSLPFLVAVLSNVEYSLLTFTAIIVFDIARYLGLKKYVIEAD